MLVLLDFYCSIFITCGLLWRVSVCHCFSGGCAWTDWRIKFTSPTFLYPCRCQYAPLWTQLMTPYQKVTCGGTGQTVHLVYGGYWVCNRVCLSVTIGVSIRVGGFRSFGFLGVYICRDNCMFWDRCDIRLICLVNMWYFINLVGLWIRVWRKYGLCKTECQMKALAWTHI